MSCAYKIGLSGLNVIFYQINDPKAHRLELNATKLPF